MLSLIIQISMPDSLFHVKSWSLSPSSILNRMASSLLFKTALTWSSENWQFMRPPDFLVRFTTHAM